MCLAVLYWPLHVFIYYWIILILILRPFCCSFEAHMIQQNWFTAAFNYWIVELFHWGAFFMLELFHWSGHCILDILVSEFSCRQKKWIALQLWIMELGDFATGWRWNNLILVHSGEIRRHLYFIENHLHLYILNIHQHQHIRHEVIKIW